MLRLIAFMVVIGLAVIWIEPRWDGSARQLTLRVRDADDIGRFGRDLAGRLFERAVSSVEVEEDRRTPAVGAGPAPAQPQATAERHTASDRERLNRLIEEKIRE